ncbi:hypothetical protein G3O06_40105 [Burkholderia sp. Ac-20345]|uniref:hypothetical protein n=1 Tax=Burkholderia sp. Ac-20345 TaxID=2703891 RepID=UPI00197BB11B|nr:hypothetical protein [Burkholderia sp. Ac-20345]MBN3783673.1 hypothetical protein [Burkholderia sp. Ac-20345]
MRASVIGDGKRLPPYAAAIEVARSNANTPIACSSLNRDFCMKSFFCGLATRFTAEYSPWNRSGRP